MKRLGLPVVAALSFLLSCDDGSGSAGEGRVRILLSAEDSISGGLALGSDVENTKDYGVHYTKFLATVGNVALRRSRSNLSSRDDRVFVVDMMQVGEEGIELSVRDGLRAGEWDKFSYETPRASADAQRHASVSEADFDEMVEHGYTYWIEGEVERGAAAGGPVRFTIKAAVPTDFHDCEYDGEPGVTVVAEGTASAVITLHGDHIFFNTFPTSAEANIERLAGYIVAADANADGEVDNDELAALDATDAFPRGRGYSLDGAPILIDTAFDFVRAQLATQGHYQGEGECIFTLDESDS